MVRTEEQLSRVREQNADVRLGTATIAQIEGGQRLCGGYSSGQRRLPLLSASGSDQRRRLAVCFLQQSTTPAPASGFPGPRCVRHKRKPHWIASDQRCRLPNRGNHSRPEAIPGDDTAVRVVTGEIPVRLLRFYPSTVMLTHLPQLAALLWPCWRVAGNPPVSSVNLVKAALPGT